MDANLDPNRLGTDQLFELIVEAARVYAWRKYHVAATGLSLRLPGVSDHLEPFPPPDPTRAAGVVLPDVQTFAPRGDAGPGPWGSGPAPRHADDFSATYWPGVGAHYFTGRKQREVVRVLWDAWKEGEPHVTQAELLAAAGSDGGRLHHLFRGPTGDHPAWGTLICRGAVPGTFTLPHDPPPAPGGRAAEE